MTLDQECFSRFVIPSTKESQSALKGDWSREYVRDALGRVSDCYIAQVEECRERREPRKAVVFISNEEEQRKTM